MTHFPKPLLTAATVSLLAFLSAQVHSDEEVSNRKQREENLSALHAAELAKKPGLRLLLAVPEGHGTTKSPLHVVIENTTDKPQNHFEEWNSWGYGNLAVEWADASGKKGVVKKVPGTWTRNGPSTVTLQPGEALVREVTFDSELWEGWPDLPYGTKLTLKVVYECAPDPKVEAWSGKTTSKDVAVLFR